MWWLFIIAGLLIILTYLLFAPFYIEINTINDLYGLRFHHLAGARLVLNDKSLFINIKVGWWQKQLDLLKPAKKRNKKKKKAGKRPSFRKGRQWIAAIFRSTQLTKCYINFDSGDMPLNGILYPIVDLIGRRSGKTVMINFYGENEVILQLRNSLGRLLWAYVKSKPLLTSNIIL